MAEHLIFEAGEQTLGLAVDCVREVVRAVSLSPPVGQESFVEGLLNLRGQVVPVVDLGQRLNLQMPALAESDYLVVLSDQNDRLCAVRACGQVRLTSEAELVADTSSDADDELPAIASETNSNGHADSPLTASYVKVNRLIVPLLNPEALSKTAYSVVKASGVTESAITEHAEGHE